MSTSTVAPYSRNTVGKGRVSQPDWISPATFNGLGFITRRGVSPQDSAKLRDLDSLIQMAISTPQQFLMMLPDLIPEVGKAVWNSLRLGCGESAIKMTAIAKEKDGVTRRESPDATQMLTDLFASQPDEIGDLEDILAKNLLMVLFSGFCAVEAVPAARNKGVKEVWPIPTTTLQFRREPNGVLGLYQRQRLYYGPAQKTFAGFISLPMERVFWSNMDPFPDDPYGRAPYSTIINEVLSMQAFLKGMLLAWHRVGTPRYDLGFDFEMWATIAKEQIGLTQQEDIEKYVQDEYDKQVADFRRLHPDDAFFHDIKSKVGVTGTGSEWPDISMIYNILRWRLIIALKEMPTLFGVVEGNTETWSTVDWQIYSQGLKTLIKKAAKPIIRAAQLHLRLSGRAETVQVEYAPIRANQRLADAQAEQLEIDNEARKRDEGWQDNDAASTAVTGSAAVAEPNYEVLGQKAPLQQPKDPIKDPEQSKQKK